MAWYDNSSSTRGFLSTALQAASNAQRAAEARANAEIKRGGALGNIGKAIGAGYGDYEDRRTKALKQQADESYRQEVLGMQKADEARKQAAVEQDRIAGSIMADLSTKGRAGRIRLPDIVSNQEDIDKAMLEKAATDKANTRILSRQEKAGEEFSRLYDKYINQANTADNSVKSLPSKLDEGYSIAGKPSSTLLSRASRDTISGAEARDRALKESGVLDVNELLNSNISIPSPKIVKGGFVDTPAKSLNKREWVADTYNKIIRDDRLTGSTKRALINDLSSQADALYGKDKKERVLTVADQIALTKLSLENKAKDARINDYKSIIMGMDKTPKTNTEEGLKKELETILKDKGKTSKDGGNTVSSTLNDMYKIYGDPDTIGTDDRADIEDSMYKLKKAYNLSDSQLVKAINASRGVYGGGFIGVQENSFKEAVEDYINKNYVK